MRQQSALTDVAPFTPEELAEARKRHVPGPHVTRWKEGWLDVVVCRACKQDWPCDAARYQATVDEIRVIARAACEMAQEANGLENWLRRGGIMNILNGLAEGEFDEDTAGWVQDVLDAR